MAWSRKNYRAMAHQLLLWKDETRPLTSDYGMLVNRVSSVLRDDNPRFNQQTFREACGIKPEVRTEHTP